MLGMRLYLHVSCFTHPERTNHCEFVRPVAPLHAELKHNKGFPQCIVDHSRLSFLFFPSIYLIIHPPRRKERKKNINKKETEPTIV
jgi:hypothetical protein